ncbi:hypothetical protein WJX73_007656 [Symbiochloris irregularis]|uniref:Uncharacterized protein n=1 Tax=Symbiochloris irregularis TaxID=706552 RepID=A0AAW1P6R8_9CHLO
MSRAQELLLKGSDIKQKLAALKAKQAAAAAAAAALQTLPAAQATQAANAAPLTGVPDPASIRAAAGQRAAALTAAVRPPGAPAHATPVPVKQPQHTLRLDDKGREVDEHGNLVAKSVAAVTSLKVNQKKPEFKRPPPPAQPTGPPKPRPEDFFDPFLGDRPARGLNRRRKGGFEFVQQGRLQKQAETARLKAEYGEDAFRAQAQLARQSGAAAGGGGDPNAVPLGKRMDANAIPLGKRPDATPAAAPLDPIPEIEWWDRPLLIKRESEGGVSHSYGEEDTETLANLNVGAITLYVQHPVKLEPPAEEAPPEAMPLMLTKKEARKMRKQRREEREKEKQELVRQGLLEAPPPKVKLSNMMRVLGTEAVADPTALEAQVRSAMLERQQAHEDRNEARKLTPDERKEKKLAKLAGQAEGQVTVQVAVFHVLSLANSKLQWRVRVNAEELHMTGCAVIAPSCGVIVAEGTAKSQKKYGKYILERLFNKRDDEEVYDRPDNASRLVWRGAVQERGFPDKFLVQSMGSDAAARSFLENRGLAHYWDAAATLATPNNRITSRQGPTPKTMGNRTAERSSTERGSLQVAGVAAVPVADGLSAPGSLPEEAGRSSQSRSDMLKRYRTVDEDSQGYWLTLQHGELPKELSGTYYKNGPCQLELGGQKVTHPFDGHGMVASIAIKDGRAFFRSKFVRSHEYEMEQKHGEFLYAASFGTPTNSTKVPGKMLAITPKNASNTSVVPFRDGILACFESSQPHKLDPHTLSTHGLDTLGGHLKLGVPFETGLSLLDYLGGRALSSLAQQKCPPGGLKLGGDAMLVHIPYCATTKRRIFTSFCISLAPAAAASLAPASLMSSLKAQLPGQRTRYTFWEFDEEDRLVARQDYSLPGYAFVHDIAVTPHHIVLFRNPVDLAQMDMLTGKCAATGAIKFRPDDPLELHIIPRPGGDAPSPNGVSSRSLSDAIACTKIGTAKASFVFHHANAWYDAPSGMLHTDSVCYDSFPETFASSQPYDDFILNTPWDGLPIAQLWRHSMHLPSGQIVRTRLMDKAVEFPAINPTLAGRKHRWVWLTAATSPDKNGPQQALVRYDNNTGSYEQWENGPRYFLDEAVFINRPGADGEDEGWIVCLGFDAAIEQSEFLVFDAAAITAGPITVLALREVLPSGIHGAWHDTYYGP